MPWMVARISGSRVRGMTASCTIRCGARRPIAPNAFFSSLPKLQAPRVVARDLHVPCATLETDPAHRLEISRDARLQAIELDEEDRFRVARIPGGVDRVFDDPDRRTIHELERCGHYAR